MFIDGIVIGILVALIMGGNFKSLLSIQVGHAWLIPISFIIQFSSIIFFPDYLFLAIILSNLALILFCISNIKITGFKYMAIGVFLNLFVMLANGGRMPVEENAAKALSPEDFPTLAAGEYGKHVLISPQTNFNFLGDVFFLDYPYPRPIIVSLGDLVLTIGVILFIYYSMVSNEKQSKEVLESAN